MYQKDKIAAFIPARGGSKGVKRKNIRNLAGKPLIYCGSFREQIYRQGNCIY